MKKYLGVLLVAALSITSSCIFGPSVKKAVSYRPGRVYLSDRQTYKVGELPAPWKRMKVRAYSIAFHNPDYGATVATDAWCGPAYEDLPLAMLTTHIMAGVDNYDIEDSYEFMLDERGALRTIVTGSVDGVDLDLDIVVLKKNDCIIDFMCITPRGRLQDVATDFDTFYGGFRYE